jgi:mono/diheme cytochrome c family protein
LRSLTVALAALSIYAAGIGATAPQAGAVSLEERGILRPLPADSAQEQVFRVMCASCHGATPAGTVPDRAALGERTPDQIFAALTTGQMRFMAQSLTQEQVRALSNYLSARPAER